MRRLLDDKMSVRQAEDAVHSDASQSTSRNSRRPTAEAAELERRLAEKLGTKVRILERGTAGRVTLRYRTLAEFERLYSLLMGEPPAVE